MGSTKLRGGRIWAEVDVLDDVPHGLGAPDGDDGKVESGIVEVVEPRLSWRTRTTTRRLFFAESKSLVLISHKDCGCWMLFECLFLIG